MKANESGIERVIRIAVGVVLLSLVAIGPKSLWGLIGIIPLVTGLVGICPIYSILGISTCKKCTS
ncbi:MAG: DUF2892 domain-containing protein [Proteobacteria bacterium]|nr:DUF2892 domain-containing protein [Pseudomonadota bacterium]